MELKAAIQNYHWGKKGKSSLVAQLSSLNQSGICDDKTYAELWMGDHPSGPSLLKTTGIPLSKFVQENPNVLGEDSLKDFGSKIPFLFKILSVEQALSIQAHPNKESAKILHAQHPNLYPDPNHKPEMAIALTPFEMMYKEPCGFRSFDEVSYFIENVPEFHASIGEEAIARFKITKDKETLRGLIQGLLSSPAQTIKEQLELLLERSSKMSADEKVKLEADLIHRLAAQFPNDVGIFFVYFLQHFTLKVGQAVFLPANEPHAYIYGDCVECMAASDNVVRAGLTPKYKDVETLCQMLTYETGKDWLMSPTSIESIGEDSILLYDPPVPEFAVVKYTKMGSFVLEKCATCSIIIVIAGEGGISIEGEKGKLSPGSVYFIPSNVEYEVIPQNGQITIFRAYSTP